MMPPPARRLGHPLRFALVAAAATEARRPFGRRAGGRQQTVRATDRPSRRRRRHARAPSEPASAPALGVGLGSALTGGGGAASGERLLTASALPDRRLPVRVDMLAVQSQRGRRAEDPTLPPPRLCRLLRHGSRSSWRGHRAIVWAAGGRRGGLCVGRLGDDRTDGRRNRRQREASGGPRR